MGRDHFLRLLALLFLQAQGLKLEPVAVVQLLVVVPVSLCQPQHAILSYQLELEPLAGVPIPP